MTCGNHVQAVGLMRELDERYLEVNTNVGQDECVDDEVRCGLLQSM